MRNPLVTLRRDRSSALSVLAHCTPIGLAILGLLWWALPASAAAGQPRVKNVLLLFGNPRQRTNFVEWLDPPLRARFPGEIAIYETYLESPAGDAAAYWDSEAESLRRRLSKFNLDLVITVGPAEFEFALQYRDKIFPHAPILFTEVGTRQFGGKTWPGVTGLTVPVGIGETIDLALKLQPDTEAIALVSPYDPFWLEATHNEILRYRDKVREIDFIGPPGPELLGKLAALPPHTVVLFHYAMPPFGQPPLAGLDLIDAVAERRPTFSAWRWLCLDHGCIGGAYEDLRKQTLWAAETAARLLSGTKPEDIPIQHSTDLQVQVDWRALQRWHIPESRLPPGSVVLYRELTLWERGRKYFVAAIFVIVLQSFLIFALFWQRARKRRAEAELRRSEEKFSKSFRHSPLAVTITSLSDARFLEVNETFEQLTGWNRRELIARTPLDVNIWVDPDQRTVFTQQLLAHGSVRDWEVRIRRKDGQTRTARVSAELIEVGGEPCALSVIADITERKQAEEVLSTVSRRLIEAHEEERTWLARELHDDINQRIAIVSVNLET
ncbi:MAG TPA: PAS domain S-box protein, partial [Terriglobia bacterium]|nr:PAS domain S-box protein [Terriglobia bacterium]